MIAQTMASKRTLSDSKIDAVRVNMLCFTEEEYKLDFYHCRNVMRFRDFCHSRSAYRVSRETIHVHFVKTHQSWIGLMKYFYGNDIRLIPMPNNLIMFDGFRKYKELISNLDKYRVSGWMRGHI
eukprot:776813_1